MRRVVVESPYAGKTLEDVEANVAYARRCALDCLARSESPYLSHLLLTQILDDNDPQQRVLGIAAGLVWGAAAELVAVYIDRGLSKGMLQGIAHHRLNGKSLVCRRLDGPAAPCDVDLGYLCTCSSATAPPAGCVLHDPSLNPEPESKGSDRAQHVVRDEDGAYMLLCERCAQATDEEPER